MTRGAAGQLPDRPQGPPASGLPADISFGRCVLRPAARQLLVDGQAVPITARAFDLLLALVERRDRVVTKDELLDLVWPDQMVEENNLQVHVAALRKHLGRSAIATHQGRGYRFVAEVRAVAEPGAKLGTITALFGREGDLKALHDLSLSHRLVTIVGAGGIGKTALARAFAAQQAGRFAHGTRFVDLASLGHAGEVPPCMAAALQTWLATRQAWAGSAGSFELLLVLDHCEHLVHAVAEWAASALVQWPGLHLLVTSQVPLRLLAEQVWRVPPLALPAGDGLADVRAASAVHLFEARARAADPGFELAAGNAPLVAAITRQLDGLALDIELAAARVPQWGLQGLHDRLHQGLQVLGTASPDAPPHRRTPAAALAWTHALLSSSERVLLRRLAVMADSFAPGSAQAVAGADGLDAWAVLDCLGSLVEKSLVAVTRDAPREAPGHAGQPRLRLLASVRLFAMERLADAGEETALRNRHLDHVLDLAEQAARAMTGPAAGAWLDRMDLEHGNLQAALAWCEHAPDGAACGLRLVTALHRYWFSRGDLQQALQACAAALSRPVAAAQHALHGQALWTAGRVAAALGRGEQAQAWLHECAAAARVRDDRPLQVRASIGLGSACAQQGRWAEARQHHQDALALARLMPGATDLLIEAAHGMAVLDRLEGRLDASLPLCEEALRRARAAGDRLSTLSLLANLCMLALAREPAQASAAPSSALRLVGQRLLEASGIADELGSARGRVTVLEVGAGLAAVQRDAARALRWDAAATRQLAVLGRQREPADLASLSPLMDRAHAMLGKAAAEAAQAAGGQMTLAEALEQVRSELTLLPY